MVNTLRRIIAFLFAIIVVLFGLKSEKVFYWAIIFILCGESIRIWSAGYIRKNKVLSIVGPYRYVRNPLYIGSFLIGVGFALFIGNFFVLILILISFGIVYTFQVKYEEKKLTEIFGEKYLEYKKNVRRWLPRITAFGLEDEKFNISLAILKNKEYNSILGCIGMIFLILILRRIL
ncbi:MAG: isoprenylcysteine carboxylmethyltransferase family protein [Elusimicrobiota bacterium]